MTYGCILDTNVLLTLKGDRAEFEELWAETQVCKLEDFFEVEWKILLHC